MALDFSKIKARKKESLPIDPIELFQKLKVSDPNINDLWLAQGDALRAWHAKRSQSDVGIVLNTGAGKTLVGLLIAQSLVNERLGKVLYICSSIQLVEQTAEKAKGYGLNITKYYRGEFNNDHFYQGKAPCITTYQAVFNGRSIFFKEDIAAIIFDDAHAAEHLLRDHFSLRLDRNNFSSLYNQMVGLFRDYHQKVGKIGSYDELEDVRSQGLFLVPPFEMQKQFNELMRLLNSARLFENQSTLFAWEHLKDKIDLCCLLISGSAITITPPFVPVRSLPYFSENVRRIYLSATLAASDAFIRTFGQEPEGIIAPTTTAGECERLILIPSRLDSGDEDVEIVKRLLSDRKALILVPTYARAAKWEGLAEPPTRETVAEEVDKFKKDRGIPKLLLAARYDGVDLPGDTCRLMVIDHLPMGVGPLEKYLWEYLSLSTSLRTSIASRICQSFGRISRGMSDHGVIFLTGDKLIQWLLTPRNIATLPLFLQKQIMLGLEISDNAKSTDDFEDALNKCLNRADEWVSTYEGFMNEAEPENFSEDADALSKIAESEADFAILFWNRDYPAAAKRFSLTLEETFDLSTNTGAWHALWLGRTLELMGDEDSAGELYARAHAAQRNIPAFLSVSDDAQRQRLPVQIIEVMRQLRVNADGRVDLPRNMQTYLAGLVGNGTANQTEESLRILGQYLGLHSSRPDKEFATGPDVLWHSPDQPALCMEVKTNKDEISTYQKKDTGQLSDHVQWVKDNIYTQEIIPIFVGPISKAAKNANPPRDFRVVSLEQFQQLGERLTTALRDIANTALPITLGPTILDIFQKRRLLWPECFQSMESYILKDL